MSVANVNGTVIPDPGSSTISVAAGVEIVSGVATPILGDGTEVSGGEIVPVLGDQAFTIVGGEVVLDRSWRTVDLSAPDAVHNTLSMVYSVTSLGSGNYRISATGTGAALDGPSDGMLQLRFPLEDSAGNTVDYASGKYFLEWRLDIVSATAGESLLIMAGLRTQPTTTGSGVPRFAGITTGTSTVDLSTCAALGSNGTTGKTGLAAVCGRITPPPIDSGSFDIGSLTVTSLDSAGARIGPPSDTATTSDGSPGTCDELHVLVGFDTAHTNTKTADVKLRYRIIQVIP